MPESLEHWLNKLEGRHTRMIDLGLDRCGAVYRNMHTPRPAATIFSVGGTNGKGSVVAYLAGILGAAGMRCGTYTSPHVLSFNERIVIDGVPAADADIVRAFERVESALNGVSLTYFEFTTLAAFFLMNEAQLDTAVLEVGLGGRLDAVNLVDADCAIITPIGLDHQDYLGPDRESIGFEKAGILRPGRPAVCGDTDPPDSLLGHARALNARLILAGKDFDLRRDGNGVRFTAASRSVALDSPPLRGRHQDGNLAMALAALEQLFPGLLDDPGLVRRGIAGAFLTGRLERSSKDARVLLDVGHNPLAAEAVAEFLRSDVTGRCFCVIGMLRDKDAEAVAEVLAPQVDEWLCAGLEGARGQRGTELANRIRARGRVSQPRSFDTVAAALSSARRTAGADDTILVFGSFETVAAALRHLGAAGVHGPAMLIES